MQEEEGAVVGELRLGWLKMVASQVFFNRILIFLTTF